MTQRIIYPTPDGGVAVVIPSPDCGLTVEEIAEKDVPADTPWRIVPTSDVPTDRFFRAAWEGDFAEPSDAPIRVGMVKAREIAHSHRRALREVEFAPLDKVVAAKIPGQDAAQAEAQREAIRVRYAAMQAAIDAAATPDDMKAALANARPGAS